MANKFTRYLFGDGNFGKGLVGGLIKPKGIMASWQHASRTFVDDTFRLAPRHKFLYYVVFDIDPRSHNATSFTSKHSQEVALLCKSAELPKFNFETVTKNQYNRKKLLYKSMNYEPVNITLHDDNSGIVSSMWAIYYAAYIQDRKLPLNAHEDLHYRGAGTSFDSYRYGLDNDKRYDFFKSISIYTMSRSRFNGYTLVNPRIQSWNHGNVDYADGGVMESAMSIQYESVQYSTGRVSTNSPKGFATLHYDVTPSPLSIQGGGTPTLFGSGGVLGGIESIFGDVAGGAAFNSPAGFLGTAIKARNTYLNIKEIKNKGLAGGELQGVLGQIISSPAAVGGIINTVGGIAGTIFPKNIPSGDSVIASAKKFFGPGGP
jgi:hypothetical protein